MFIQQHRHIIVRKMEQDQFDVIRNTFAKKNICC